MVATLWAFLGGSPTIWSKLNAEKQNNKLNETNCRNKNKIKNGVYIVLLFFQDRPVLLSCWCWLVSWRIFRLPSWRLSWMWLAWDTIRALCVMPCPGQMGCIGFIVTHGANTSSHCWDKTWRMLDRTPQRSVQICLSIYPFIPSVGSSI